MADLTDETTLPRITSWAQNAKLSDENDRNADGLVIL